MFTKTLTFNPRSETTNIEDRLSLRAVGFNLTKVLPYSGISLAYVKSLFIHIVVILNQGYEIHYILIVEAPI